MHCRTSTMLGIFSLATWAMLPVMAAWLGPVPAMQLNMLAFATAFVLYLVIWTFEKAPIASYFKLKPHVWGIGLVGIFGFHMVYFLAFKHAPSVEAFLIVEFWPLLLLIFSSLFGGTKLKTEHYIGAALALCGVLLAITKGDWNALFFVWKPGHALALLAAVIWSGYSVMNKRFSADIPGHAVGMFCGLAAVLSGICHFLFEAWQPLSLLQWVVIAVMGALPMGISFVWWQHGMQKGNMALLGILAFAITVIGTLLLVLFGYAPFSVAIVFATILVTLGGIMGSGITPASLKKAKDDIMDESVHP